MRVYLAGGYNHDQYRLLATEMLLHAGHPQPINPMRAERDFRGREAGNEKEIVEGDLSDVIASDVVLADFTTNDVGTSMECWFAHSIGKPVISFFGSNRRSPWAVFISRSCHESLEDAVAAIGDTRSQDAIAV